MATLKLEGINKIYPNGVQAVFDFNLTINDRDFIVLVGPSGCGKSTTLRMIAGLEEITSGHLFIEDVLVNDFDAKERDVAMVFQSYALYPHMTVYDNMAYGLKLRKMSRDFIEKQVITAALSLDLVDYLDRKPAELSGGQRQRVALGRAMVRDAKIFLMDEPLSNLDAKLRVKTRGELIKLHRKLKTTSIYVTHDQVEAMTMATRMVVMSMGYVQQVGAPEEIYEYPINKFVAGFIGTPPMNFIRGIVRNNGFFESKDCTITMPPSKLSIVKDNGFIDKEVVLGIRPENIFEDKKFRETNPHFLVSLVVEATELLGAETNIFFQVNERELCANISKTKQFHIGEEIIVAFDMEKAHFFDPESTLRLTNDEDQKNYIKLMERNAKKNELF